VNAAISDTDILSTFGKIGRVDLLQRLFNEIYVAPALSNTRINSLGLREGTFLGMYRSQLITL